MNIKTTTTIILTITTLAAGTIPLASCKDRGGVTKEGKEILYYTCPMHPQVRQDKPGDCPICNMKLNPVYEEESGHNHGEGSSVPGGGPSVLISPERQQQIGLKTETVRKQPAVREIRTVGRVAFDPELAVAQREYLEIARNVPSLKEPSRSRLRLLGMGDEEIGELERKGPSTSLYLPKRGESVWVYATLYQGELDLVGPGLPAEVSRPAGSDKTFFGTVRAVDPVIDPMTRSARARIEVAGAGGELRPDSYVDVSLKIDLGDRLTIPKSALIDTGERKVAFVVHEGGHFESRNLKTGPELNNEVVVLEGLKEGEAVVASATFLVDSESQLRGAIAGMEGHQH